ncbi:MAG: glycosyltransferase family 4 protein [Ginsengibacter sp.]
MKPKILFILHIPPPVHGAAMVGKYIQDSLLINSDFDTQYVNLSTSNTNKEVGKGGINKIFIFFTLIGKILKKLFSEKFDLCYMTLTAKGYGFYKDFIIVAILKFFGKKIIYHFHNKGVKENHHRTIDNLMYRFTFQGTQCILLSPLLYNDISKYVRIENVDYCANGIPEIPNKSSSLKIYQKAYEPCRILFLSNMTIEKGVIVLLDACKILKDNNYFFECNFVGDWVNISKEYFNDYVSKNDLSSCVVAYGKKYNEEKNEFFRSADIFVFPTFYHNECFPLVLLEAMQFNLPVISTNEGGIADIISDGKTGFIVPKNNPSKLADKLGLLINNNNLIMQMGVEGNNKFHDLFTLEQFEKKFVLILKDAIKQ